MSFYRNTRANHKLPGLIKLKKIWRGTIAEEKTKVCWIFFSSFFGYSYFFRIFYIRWINELRNIWVCGIFLLCFFTLLFDDKQFILPKTEAKSVSIKIP